ncbi:hypothetical protein ON010_g18680 [Phytophthora cinnamomi]|nr:hypothetical protein ON010_g18680 [Phytophthora cinnamomi]
MNTPLATDIGSEAESQTDGRASVQRSPAFAPTPSPRLSPMQLHSSAGRDQDDDKEVDLLEDDILDGMETKPAEPPRQKEYLTDPAYLKLLPMRERLQKSVPFTAGVSSSLWGAIAHVTTCYPPAFVSVQNRFKQMLETATKQRTEIAAELDRVNAEIAAFESS